MSGYERGIHGCDKNLPTAMQLYSSRMMIPVNEGNGKGVGV